MSGFTYKEVYQEAGRRVLEVNVLPEKCCNFDCIFCPIGRAERKTDTQRPFEGAEEALQELERRLDTSGAELVFLNAMGEALVHSHIGQVIDRIKGRGLAVRLLSNGYLLGQDPYRSLAAQCDEVIGELKVVTEADFQKVQRPVQGYTLEAHIRSMASFRRRYPGQFLLEITILRGYSDSEAAVAFFRQAIRTIRPDKVLTVRLEDPRFAARLGVDDHRFHTVAEALTAP